MRLAEIEGALARGEVSDALEPIAADVLRRELALLRAHPEQALPVLQKWLGWEPRAELGVWIAELDREWWQLHGGRRRLRWLRSPVPDAPVYSLVFERASIGEVSSDPFEVIVCAPDGTRAWRPETGALTSATQQMPQQSEVDFELRGDSWGPHAVHRRSTGAKLGDVQVPEYGTVMASYFGEGEAMIAGCGDEYFDGYVHIYNLPSMELSCALEWQRVIWSANRYGRWVVGHSDERVIWDLTTGAVVATIGGKGSLAISPDGRWLVDATSDGVRVWPWPSKLQTPNRRGFDPRFALAGQRLLSGQNLYDGERGTWIAALDFHRGEYLEGGPPPVWLHEGGSRLVTCDGFFRAWDLETGVPIRGPRDVRFAHWSRVALSPSGRFLACYRVPVGRDLAVVDLDREAEIAFDIDVSTIDQPERLAFSSDRALFIEGDAGIFEIILEGDCPITRVANWPDAPVNEHSRYELRSTAGAIEVFEDGEVVAHMTAETNLVAHPNKPIWAGPSTHVALE